MNILRVQDEIEIIEFQLPIESQKNLYICNISVDLQEDEASLFVREELRKAFSKFGLLHSVLPFIGKTRFPNRGSINASSPEKLSTTNDSIAARDSSVPTSHEPSCCLYAFVNFYSKLSARKAKEHLHLTKIVGTTPCRIKFSQRKKSVSKQKEPLYPDECINVANFYLGFDGWSTSIKLMKRDDPPVAEENNHQSVCRFLCVIELVIPRHGLTTHGIGSAKENLGTDVSKKGDALCKCRKIAFREAVRNAFSRVLLVVIGGGAVEDGVGHSSGKVHAEINTTIPDPFITAECLQDPTMLTVTELLEEPKEESSDEENDEDIDNEMIHILADLQSENSSQAALLDKT